MTAIRDPAAFATLVGTPSEVRSRLDKFKAEQVIVLPVARAAFHVVEEFAASERGSGGFGSTGQR